MITYRPYQLEAVNSLFDFFEKHGGTQDKANPLVAMPTGSGKSLVIGGFAHRAIVQFPKTRIMMLTHVRELIQQNSNAILSAWPQAPLGVYSAGLKRREKMHQITYGGVASVYKKLELFGWQDLLLIDEAHLLSPNDGAMYMRVIEHFRKINPYFRVCGFTATKFRRGQGLLTQDGIFSQICYDLTNVEGFNRLIREGYLCPLIPKRTKLSLDVSDVGVVAGEYNQGELERAVDVDKITKAACLEACHWGSDRRSWLAFCSGIDHAEHVATALNALGVKSAAVHSKMPDKERDARIAAFKRGELRCLTNNNVLTTGFDYPPIDLILGLRPTVSPVLHVQMNGRGTRPSLETHKQNCLVLDYARNTERLGPINDPVIPRKKGKGNGEIPIKICPVCDNYCHISARICDFCGHEFEFETKIVKTASEAPLLKEDWPIIETFDVDRVMYAIGRKAGMPEYIRATYFCGYAEFNEVVCLEHNGYAGIKAKEWWRQRHTSEPPHSSREAIKLQSQLRAPKRIYVHTNKTYPEIQKVEF